MKVLMISDASSAGAEDAAALGEVRHVLESKAHDVDIVRISPTTFSGDLETEAVALLQGADVVVFGNGDQASKGFVEKVLLLSDGLHAERDALQADNDSLRASNEGLTRDNADLRAGNDALTKDNADLRAGNDALTKDNADLRAGNDALTKDNADLRAGNDALTKDNADLRAGNDALTKDNDDLRAGNDALTKDNDTLRASNDTYVRINSSLQESNEALTRDNDSLRAGNDALTKDNTDLRAGNDALTKDNDSLRASNDTYVRINSSLQESNDALTKDNADLRAGNDVLTKDNANLRAGNDALTKDNADLRAGNDALTKDNADLRAGNDELTRSNASLQASNDTYVRINSSLQESNDALTKDNDSLRASNDSLERDNASLRESNTGLTQDNDDLLADNDTLRHDSREDALTHILNRRGFNQDWPKFMLAHPTFILISVDINDFKLFNDIYGHHIGDQLLMALADEFRDLLPEGDIVARSGGDEFVLLIASPTDEWMHQTSDFFNRMHSFEFEGVPYTYMLSGGFAAYPEQTESFPTLLRMADSALYHAKMLAKDKFFKYSADMDNDFRVSLGFNARSLASTAPAAMLIFKASGDHEILFANTLCAELLGFASVSELMGTDRSLAHMVHPDDLDQLERRLADRLAHPDTQKLSCAIYQALDKDGKPRSVLAMARMSYNEHFGHIFHAFLFDPEVIGHDLEAIGT